MDDNKLYNALLKNQKERGGSGEARKEDNFRKERPFAGVEPPRRAQGAVQGADSSEPPPTIYDSAMSLELIGNPNPWSRDQLREKKIIYPGMPDKEVMDAYRELRIQLRSRHGEGNFAVMFSSLGPASNSLATAYNLAAAFALDSHTSALLVDCDPYNHDLQNLVSVPLHAGATDYVADRSLSIKDILYPSGVARLSVVPAGTQASSAVELFASVRMRELISELKSRYPDRCIVINAPAFRDNTEARILERFADQVVFGVPFGQVTGEEIADAVGLLETDKFAGLVFQE